MAGYKNGKIMLPIKEFLIVKGQVTYELNTIDMTKVTVFYRKYNQEAFLETYSEMPKGDYRINEVGGNKQLEITNLDILDKYYSIQLCRVVDLTSSQYSPSGQVDTITLNQHLNEVIADVTFLFTYLKDVGMVMDSSSGNKIMAELKPYTTWYMDKDGNMAAMPVDSLFEKFNDLVQELRQEVLKLLEQDLEVAERELLEGVKTQLDEYVETDLKQRLDDYTTQLEERLQTMIDQAVADKGLMPEGSDWLEIGLGNWLVVDLFNKNYIHYPPQLNSSDNAGVVKKDITDGGNSQVIRFYTTTGKMLFIVRANEVWSEWQELGEQTDTMQFTQANHGFIFTAVTLDGATRQWVKANKYTSADGIAIKIDNDRFDVVTRGVVNIPTSARDDKGNAFVYDEYYFLSQEVDGGLSRTKNEIGTFQYLAHISEIDGKQVAYIDIGDSYDLDYEVVDTENADRVGIGTYKTTLRTADTIEDLKRLNLKVGDVIEVLGYYTKGDGANHKRKIESEDDGSGVQLSNGLYANIVHNGEVNVSWFGAKGNGTDDDTISVQKALDYTGIGTLVLRGKLLVSQLEVKSDSARIIKGEDKTTTLLCDSGEYCITGSFNYKTLQNFIIECKERKKINYGLKVKDDHSGMYQVVFDGIEFKNFKINVYIWGVIVNFNNCKFRAGDVGIYFKTGKTVYAFSTQFTFSNCYFDWNAVGVQFGDNPSSFQDIAYNIMFNENTTFENNTKAFESYARAWSVTLDNVWFESNRESSSFFLATDLTFINTFIHQEEKPFVYNAGDKTNMYTLLNLGTIQANTIKSYKETKTDSLGNVLANKNYTRYNWSVGNRGLTLAEIVQDEVSKVKSVTPMVFAQNTRTAYAYNYFIYIKGFTAEGVANIVDIGIPDYVNVSVTKDNDTIKVDFGNKIIRNPHIEVMSYNKSARDLVGNSRIKDIIVQPYSNVDGNYQNYFAINGFKIECRDIDGTVNNDGFITIHISSNELFY